eukprot:CAMPEP_0117492720 /NCGR_PEP_ID=MMETSP0784-20121206/18730_1 /TAXON_ID=39447 /ORGANISM="" /LENGTH=609 /DNA_ID=CAMNT_0005287555 /DNA_START=79 /DNA_END=1908 /DNA_ORIENTATION=+
MRPLLVEFCSGGKVPVRVLSQACESAELDEFCLGGSGAMYNLQETAVFEAAVDTSLPQVSGCAGTRMEVDDVNAEAADGFADEFDFSKQRRAVERSRSCILRHVARSRSVEAFVHACGRNTQSGAAPPHGAARAAARARLASGVVEVGGDMPTFVGGHRASKRHSPHTASVSPLLAPTRAPSPLPDACECAALEKSSLQKRVLERKFSFSSSAGVREALDECSSGSIGVVHHISEAALSDAAVEADAAKSGDECAALHCEFCVDRRGSADHRNDVVPFAAADDTPPQVFACAAKETETDEAPVEVTEADGNEAPVSREHARAAPPVPCNDSKARARLLEAELEAAAIRTEALAHAAALKARVAEQLKAQRDAEMQRVREQANEERRRALTANAEALQNRQGQTLKSVGQALRQAKLEEQRRAKLYRKQEQRERHRAQQLQAEAEATRTRTMKELAVEKARLLAEAEATRDRAHKAAMVVQEDARRLQAEALRKASDEATALKALAVQEALELKAKAEDELRTMKARTQEALIRAQTEAQAQFGECIVAGEALQSRPKSATAVDVDDNVWELVSYPPAQPPPASSVQHFRIADEEDGDSDDAGDWSLLIV